MAPARPSGEIGAAAMHKAMWRILPLILVAYLFAYMDRVNVSFAAAEMNKDLGFSATIYGLGGGLFFLGYALLAIPSNLMLVRFGARRWIALIMVVWGLLSAGMLLVQTPLQFYVTRFLLGVAEAGFYPGVITYFADWFPPCHRSRAVSRFFVASPLASVAMGAMAGSLLGLDGRGGLEGWQWLFLVQGLPTVLIGLVVLWFLPDRPDTAAWLSVPEKDWIDNQLAIEQSRIEEPTAAGAMASLRNPRVLLCGALGFLLMSVIITFNLSAPILLGEATGLGVTQIGYIVSLGGLLGAGTILLLGNVADRLGDRLLVATFATLVMAAALASITAAPGPMVAGLAYLVYATVSFTIPMLTSSTWPELLHGRQLAAGSAAINMLSQIGAFAAPFAWGAARDASGSFQAGLVALVLISLTVAVLVLVLRRQLYGRALPAATA